MNRKKIGQILLAVILLTTSFVKVWASEPSFSFFPSSGVVENTQEGFTVDILLDSGIFNITKARAVVKFDPEVLQLREALRNNTLFEAWPEEESTTDNTNGIVMLTGYTGLESTMPLFNSDGNQEVFARLNFDIVSDSSAQILLRFEYSGTDEPFKSVILDDSTPAVNVLITQPSSAIFTLEEKKTPVPNTGIDRSTIGIYIGVILILGGAFVRGSRVNLIGKRRGTIVLES